MGVVIYVDNREHALIEFQKKLVYKTEYTMLHGHPIEWRVGALDVGDMQIYETDSKTHLVFERKTFQDIASSIKDGRYREQKARLLAHYRPEQIMYILEDFNTQLFFSQRTTRTSFFGLSKSTFEGFLINTMYRDKIHIHRSSGVEETFFFVYEIAKRVLTDAALFPKTLYGGGAGAAEETPSKDPKDPNGLKDPKDYIDSCKIKEKKIKNITPLVCFQMQLGQIPFISSSISKQLSQVYSSMKTLLEDLNRQSSHKERLELLTKIPLVGKKKAAAILDYLGFMDASAAVAAEATRPEAAEATKEETANAARPEAEAVETTTPEAANAAI